jgi:ribosomal protein S18 acetylase RimI-like enzyme
MNTIIRHAKLDDLSILNQLMFFLHDEHHQAEPFHFKPASEVMLEKNIEQYILAPDALVFVAVEQQQIVGFITGHFGEFESSISKAIMMGSIDELYVVPNSRSHGIGTQLLTRCATEFKDYGINQLYVEVWDFNQSALKLYTSLGYQSHIHCLRKTLTEQ